MKSVRLLVVLGLFAVFLVPAMPAVAINDFVCRDVPDAGFVDVSPSSVHKADIDCIWYWGITNQVGTYNPDGLVIRGHMALFLTRTLDISTPLPSGSLPPGVPGFNDLASLDAAQVTAISQLRQLNITLGAGAAGTYDPFGAVTRWQMALFLTRLVTASGIALPNGADQGFTDIASLTPEARLAINQVRQLGITLGTSATTYTPSAYVTRAQMASFLARTLKITFADQLTLYAEQCTPPIAVPITPGTICTGSATFLSGDPVIDRPGWFYELPYASPADAVEFESSGTKVDILLDGVVLPSTERKVFGLVNYRRWEVIVPPGLIGPHQFELRWYYNGVLIFTDIVTITFV